MISSISLFDIISIPDEDDYAQILRFFLCIRASARDAVAVNPRGIKTLLANGLIFH